MHLLIFMNFPLASTHYEQSLPKMGKLRLVGPPQHLVHNWHDGPMRMVLNMQFLTKILLAYPLFQLVRMERLNVTH